MTVSLCFISQVWLAVMPIASGAAGRVDSGVDTSMTWTTDGLKKKTKPANRNYNSYLQRYQEKRKKNKSSLVQETQDNTHLTDETNDDNKEDDSQENGCFEDPPPKESGGRKSSLCIIL
ncbi:uncharacterized protein V6R79_006757 [Siganus canaliculatus]